MNIRQAILKAADSIEKNPSLFSWMSTALPDSDCGTPGCALGWIAHYRQGGAVFGTTWIDVKTIGIGAGTFYNRMGNIGGYNKWKDSSIVCAETLRKYADKYHPAQSLPESVLAIFNEKAVA